jgi:hypothetical protein
MKVFNILVLVLSLASLTLSSVAGDRMMNHPSNVGSVSESPISLQTARFEGGQLKGSERRLFKTKKSRFLITHVQLTAVKGSCINKNPFLAMYGEPIGVKGMPLPSTSTVCNSVWSVSKTCCRADALIKHVNAEQKRLDDASKSLIKVIKELSEKAKKVTQYGLKKDSKVSFLTIYQDSDLGETLEQSALKCTDYMKKVRSSVVCSLCAGDSEKYYYGNKISISKNSCDAMLSKCVRLIQTVIITIDGVNSLDGQVESIKNTKKESLVGEVVKLANELHKLTSKSNVIQLLHVYSNSDKSDVLHADAMRGLCGMFFSLVKATFYEDFKILFDSMLNFSDDIVKMQKKMAGEGRGNISQEGAAEGLSFGLTLIPKQDAPSRTLDVKFSSSTNIFDSSSTSSIQPLVSDSFLASSNSDQATVNLETVFN